MAKWESAFPHQIEGAEYLAKSGGGILADEMGLGKGLTSLIWLDKIGAKRTLVTGPKEITSNLKSEIPKWVTDKPIFDLRGFPPQQREAVFEVVRGIPSYIALMNLEGWSRDQETINRLVSLQFDSAIIDEAHNVNNNRTLTYRGLREIIYAINQCPECSYPVTPKYTCRRTDCIKYEQRFQHRWCLGCGHVATRIVIPRCVVCGADPNKDLAKARSLRNVLEMTGTPLLNHPKNLLWLLSLVDERFRSERAFLDTYCSSVHGNKYQWTPTGKDKLGHRIKPYYLARKRTDTGIRLPPQSIQVREYEFDKVKYREQWDAYKRLADNFKLDLQKETVGVTEVVVQLTRLRQMLVWPRGIKIRDPITKEVVDQVSIARSFKLDIVERLAREFLETERIVVFSHFKEPLRELQRRLGDCATVYDGDTPQSHREAVRHDFSAENKHPRWSALLCNYRSAGEGLNLVGATQAILLDEEWSPGRNQQAYGRINRIGQTKETGVHIPRVLGTVDTWMAELNEFKGEIVDGFEEGLDIAQKLLEMMQ